MSAALALPAPSAGLDRSGWVFANPRWVECLKAGTSLVPPLPLNDNLAKAAVEIFDGLRLPDVPGTPTIGESGNEWLRDIVRALFGSWDAARQVRFIEEIFVAVPKKNGKTTGAAGIMLTALLMNERPHAQFALFGPTLEVAGLAFTAVKGMIEADPELQALLHVQEHLKIVSHRRTRATLKVMTFDAKVATGGKYAGALIDEVHLLGSVSYAADVLRQIRGGRISIAEGFLIFITTQSDEVPAGVFKKELHYARGVRDGRITGGVLLPILYEFPEDMQRDEKAPWRNPANWHWVTPNFGHSITLERLITGHQKAIEDGEEKSWASQHLNIQIGMALHDEGWSGARYWSARADRTIAFETLLSRCEVLVFGADGGGLDDLFGFAAMGREKETAHWLGWNKAWADRGVLEVRKEIAPRLLDFEKDGDLILIEGEENGGADAAEMLDFIKEARAAGLTPEKNGLGLDRSGVAVNLLIDSMLADGIPQEFMRAVGQGYRLQGAHGSLAKKLKAGTFWHAGQPIMDWCVGNAKAVVQGHAIVITKETSGVAKIDPLIATFNAAELLSWNPVADSGLVTGSDILVVF